MTKRTIDEKSPLGFSRVFFRSGVAECSLDWRAAGRPIGRRCAASGHVSRHAGQVLCHVSQRADEDGGADTRHLNLADVPSHAETWEKVIRKLRAGMMPPAGMPRPDHATSDGLASWLEREIDRAAAANPNPGTKAPFHRLNRAEYQNVDSRSARRWRSTSAICCLRTMPATASTTSAACLKINQPLMERYLSAARRISRIAMGSADAPATSLTVRLRPDLPQFDRRRRPAVWHTRRHGDSAHVPARRRLRDQAAVRRGTAPGPRQLELNSTANACECSPITPPVRGRGQAAQDPDPSLAITRRSRCAFRSKPVRAKSRRRSSGPRARSRSRAREPSFGGRVRSTKAIS